MSNNAVNQIVDRIANSVLCKTGRWRYSQIVDSGTGMLMQGRRLLSQVFSCPTVQQCQRQTQLAALTNMDALAINKNKLSVFR
eukprot:6458716-Amphidinium_carterae.1